MQSQGRLIDSNYKIKEKIDKIRSYFTHTAEILYCNLCTQSFKYNDHPKFLENHLGIDHHLEDEFNIDLPIFVEERKTGKPKKPSPPRPRKEVAYSSQIVLRFYSRRNSTYICIFCKQEFFQQDEQTLIFHISMIHRNQLAAYSLNCDGSPANNNFFEHSLKQEELIQEAPPVEKIEKPKEIRRRRPPIPNNPIVSNNFSFSMIDKYYIQNNDEYKCTICLRVFVRKSEHILNSHIFMAHPLRMNPSHRKRSDYPNQLMDLEHMLMIRPKKEEGIEEKMEMKIDIKEEEKDNIKLEIVEEEEKTENSQTEEPSSSTISCQICQKNDKQLKIVKTQADKLMILLGMVVERRITSEYAKNIILMKNMLICVDHFHEARCFLFNVLGIQDEKDILNVSLDRYIHLLTTVHFIHKNTMTYVDLKQTILIFSNKYKFPYGTPVSKALNIEERIAICCYCQKEDHILNFMAVPRQMELRRRWIEILGERFENNIKIIPHPIICKLHFMENAFTPTGRFKRNAEPIKN